MTSKKNYELAKKLFKENEPYKHPIAIDLISRIIEPKEEKRVSKNSDMDEIHNHLAHSSDEMNSVIGGGKYYEKNQISG